MEFQSVRMISGSHTFLMYHVISCTVFMVLVIKRNSWNAWIVVREVIKLMVSYFQREVTLMDCLTGCFYFSKDLLPTFLSIKSSQHFNRKWYTINGKYLRFTNEEYICWSNIYVFFLIFSSMKEFEKKKILKRYKNKRTVIKETEDTDWCCI